MTTDDTSSAPLTVVHVADDCGNAPRKIVIRDFLIALYRRDVDEVVGALKDDIRWEVVGSQVMTGIDEVRDWLQDETPAVELNVNTIITHGPDCGADGSVIFADGTVWGYSYVIIFAGQAKTAKIKEIRTYMVVTGQ